MNGKGRFPLENLKVCSDYFADAINNVSEWVECIMQIEVLLLIANRSLHNFVGILGTLMKTQANRIDFKLAILCGSIILLSQFNQHFPLSVHDALTF